MHLLRVMFLLACLAVAGCGGDDEEAPAQEAPTKAEFVKQANEICETGQSEINKEGEALGQDATDEEVAGFLADTFIPSVREQVSDIRDLGFPEGDEEQLGEIFDETEAVLDTIEEDPAASIGGDDPFKAVNSKLESYGITACT